MLFGIAGRKASGKTTAAKVFIEQGCSRASFAAALKEYTCRLYDWQLEEVSTQQGKETPLTEPVKWTRQTCREFSKMADIDLPFEGEHVFKNRREALTTIGTDIIRKHDPNFHIREFSKRFTSGDFVCDDIRFPNEYQVVSELGYECAYVIRPYHWSYSNHASETSVRRKDFQTSLLNNRQISDLVDRSRNFLLQADQIEDVDELNHDAFYEINETSAHWAGVFFGLGKLNRTIELTDTRPHLIEGFADYVGVDTSKIEKNDGIYHLSFVSPYIVDDFKMWDIVPTSGNVGILEANPAPFAVKDSPELFSCWVDGLLEIAK